MSTNNFRSACDDYRYLRARGYPEAATLKIVADKHRLSRQERNCLFRGVIAPQSAEARRKKIVTDVEAAGQPWGIDWYNVLITVESYLRGHAVFLCDDGMVRDASGTHGSYRVSGVTAKAREAIMKVLAAGGPSRVDVFLDAPIGHLLEADRRAPGLRVEVRVGEGQADLECLAIRARGVALADQQILAVRQARTVEKRLLVVHA